jgi:RNA exonuclease 1
MDCEMGTALSGDSELIRVTVIDYFSGAVLVNNMVEPDVPMSHLNTRFSGVSWADIRNAKKQGTCLAGKASARSAVWNYVGPETIVIGHGVSNDLRALRWIHTLILDSFVMESSHTKIHENDASKTIDGEVKEDNGSDDLIARMERSTVSGLQVTAEATTTPGQKKRRGSPGRLSLKTLVNKYLDVDIQTAGKKGHDSLEDAVAARNLVHWMITESKRTCCGARP